MTSTHRKAGNRWIWTPLLLLAACTSAAIEPAPEPRVASADPASGPVKATLGDVKFLVGHWKGEGFGGICELVWIDSAGGAMLGMFRVVKDDAVSFQELMNVVASNGSLLLRVKHFDGAMVGWEEKQGHMAFNLVKLDKQTAWFDGLTLHRSGAQNLDVYLSMVNDNGKESLEVLHLTKRPM